MIPSNGAILQIRYLLFRLILVFPPLLEVGGDASAAASAAAASAAASAAAASAAAAFAGVAFVVHTFVVDFKEIVRFCGLKSSADILARRDGHDTAVQGLRFCR